MSPSNEKSAASWCFCPLSSCACVVTCATAAGACVLPTDGTHTGAALPVHRISLRTGHCLMHLVGLFACLWDDTLIALAAGTINAAAQG
jgi:hypothetical protein